jgi:hypothetical protein
MKTKQNYSSLMEEATAKGIIGVYGAIVVFISTFAVWSVCCVGGAIIELFA